jgi:cellulose synthase/poly-beta-1,6-N-acetylglucosamine synthase-like glycosyltransferase
MQVSIIIPTRGHSPYLIESLLKCTELDFEDFEVIMLSDEPVFVDLPRTRVVVTGKISPSQKRNLGAQLANGEILAFLDDDAFPRSDWLRRSVEVLSRTCAGAVCGPGVSAPTNDEMELAASYVIESALVNGPVQYRFIPSKMRMVDDFPTFNLLIRKSVFEEAGGFNQSLYPGEDTKLCLDITHRLGRDIVYHPDIMVYHHRRPLFAPHLAQIMLYARTRGRFVRLYPETSRKLKYFIPSALLTGFGFVSVLSLWSSLFRAVLGLTLLCYVGAVIVAVMLQTPKPLFWKVGSGIVLTHLCYGSCFLLGLLSFHNPNSAELSSG